MIFHCGGLTLAACCAGSDIVSDGPSKIEKLMIVWKKPLSDAGVYIGGADGNWEGESYCGLAPVGQGLLNTLFYKLLSLCQVN